MKHCSYCGLNRPTSDFYRNNRTKDGFQARCKDCCKSYQKAWHQKNPEYAVNYRRDNGSILRDRYKDPRRTALRTAIRNLRLYRGLSEEDLEVSYEYRDAIDLDPCYYCGADASAVDHYVPVAFPHHPGGLTGTDVWYNLVRACKTCNSVKKNRCGTWMKLRQPQKR